MMTAALARLGVGLVGFALLAACQDGSGGFLAGKPKATDGAGGAAPATRSVMLVDRDVEAPEVFSVNDMALWDGRPSLGGVWVASPEVKDPERVILRNTANGKFVIGALFRRENQNPGPRLQISSDAAEALGILAGQPVKLAVTALRREEAQNRAPDAGAPLLGQAQTLPDEDLDPTASAAAAAIDKADKTNGAKTANTAGTTPAAATAPEGGAGGAAPVVTTLPATGTARAGGMVQVGIFSVEENAKRASETLAKSGIAAQIRTETSKGKTYWSVVAPAGAAALDKIRAAGFKDAYALKG